MHSRDLDAELGSGGGEEVMPETSIFLLWIEQAQHGPEGPSSGCSFCSADGSPGGDSLGPVTMAVAP